MKKTIAIIMVAVLLMAASVMGTLAYLTAKTDAVKNTFTVGKVEIELDEAKVDAYGNREEGAERVKENNYKLIPGHTYTKDPTVTVKSGSEPSYIKMTVTFSNANELDAIFALNGAELTSIFNDYNADNWIAKGNTNDTTANTRTYEFWYKEAVGALNGEVKLEALFDSITVPVEITQELLANIMGMTINVQAYAIQADGFKSATNAWTAFEVAAIN